MKQSNGDEDLILFVLVSPLFFFTPCRFLLTMSVTLLLWYLHFPSTQV
jgi:hypothetical protein